MSLLDRPAFLRSAQDPAEDSHQADRRSLVFPARRTIVALSVTESSHDRKRNVRESRSTQRRRTPGKQPRKPVRETTLKGDWFLHLPAIVVPHPRK